MIELRARGGKLVLLAMGLAIAALALATTLPLWANGISAILVVAVGWLARRHHVRRRMIVDADGIEEVGVGRLAWDDVRHYHYSSALDRVAVRAMTIGAPRRLQTGRLELVGPTKLSLIGDAWRDSEPAFDLAFEQLHARMRTRVRDYAPISLGAGGISLDGDTLPLEDIVRVEVRNGLIRIFTASGVWRAVALARVRNAMLLVEELNTRGVDIGLALNAPRPRIQHDADVPPSPLPVAKTR